MGIQVTTIHTLFASMLVVLQVLPNLIRAAHKYNLAVVLVLELLRTCVRTMLIYLSQVNGNQCAIKKS